MNLNRPQISHSNPLPATPPWPRFFRRREAHGVIALVAMLVFMSLASPYFLSERNIFNILRNMSSLTILGIGMTMAIVSGGIDVSVGATLAVTSMLAARMMYPETANAILTGYPPWLAIASAFLFGMCIGFATGITITKLRVSPFLATLGMLSIGRGLAYILATGIKGSVAANIPVKNQFVQFLGLGRLHLHGFAIPMPVIIMLSLILIFSLFLRYATLGRQIYAVGANEEAARLSGVPIDAVKIFVYVLSGLLAALAGLIDAGLVASAATNAGLGNELEVVAAVAIGGTSLAGGSGNVFGCLLGGAIMAVLKNSFVLLHLSVHLQTVAIGVVIILAVALDSWRRRV